ncbi:MAG: arginine--tRNA ligase, partial [Lachnospiraceae bacterium]|nr:arginine--tRNA ligase [Lachnospiraceae bacterium]
MKKILDLISEEMQQAFEKAGYEKEAGKVTLSNRPDLCEYQCNGAMALAKKYKKAPIAIANDVAAMLQESVVFEDVSAVAPGFLNCTVKKSFVTDYLSKMLSSDKFGLDEPEKKKKIVIDYGGPNVAKPLHVGHLRSAVIGESVKRIARFAGHNVVGD